jgi:hypothetical protein
VVADEVATEVELGPLYDALRRTIDPLNVEGATVRGPELVLLTRRTGRAGHNALVRLDLSVVMAELSRSRPCLQPRTIVDVVEVELGAVAGTPLGFTDAAVWRDGMLFAAAAEVTDDPVADGACVGCELGWLDPLDRVRWREPVAPTLKVEGIAVVGEDELVAVADADDPMCGAPLLRGRLTWR